MGAKLILAFKAKYRRYRHEEAVAFNGVPVPGVTVTATHGTQEIATVTDVQGIFEFANLSDGDWVIRTEMQGFAPQEEKLRIDKATPASSFDLKMLSVAEMLASAKAMLPVVVAKPLVPKEKKKTADDELPPPPAAAGDAEKSADGMLINGSENNAATSKYSISPAFGSRRPGAKGLYIGSVGTQISASPFDARPYSLTGLSIPKASYNRITSVFTLGGPLKIPQSHA